MMSRSRVRGGNPCLRLEVSEARHVERRGQCLIGRGEPSKARVGTVLADKCELRVEEGL